MKGTIRNRMPWFAGLFVLLLACAILPVAAQTITETEPSKKSDKSNVAENGTPLLAHGLVAEEEKKSEPRSSGDEKKTISPGVPKASAVTDEKSMVKGCPIHSDETLISSRFDATVNKMLIRTGDTVKKGQVIAELDSSREHRQLRLAKIEVERAILEAEDDGKILCARKSAAIAKANYEQSKQANERVPESVPKRELHRLRLICEQKTLLFEQALHEQYLAKKTVDVKQEELVVAIDRVKQRKILSPVGGVVTKCSIKEGEWIKTGGTIIQVIDLENLRVEGLLDIRKHTPNGIKNKNVAIEVSLNGERIERFLGKVAVVHPVLEAGQHYRVWVEVQNRRDSKGYFILKPGMIATMTILADE